MPFRFGTQRSLGLPIGGGGAILKPQDVFLAQPYDWDGGAGKVIPVPFDPDFAWLKSRNQTNAHAVISKGLGQNTYLSTNLIDAQKIAPAGYAELGPGVVRPAVSFGSAIAWIAKFAPKFMVEVTWTGDGTSNRQIPHGLGVPPGMVIVKRRDAAVGNWNVGHRSLGTPFYDYIALNQTGGIAPGDPVLFNGASSTTFTIGSSATVNASGGTYVAYLFAHDPSADGIVQCGSFTTDSAGAANVALGWRPQLLLAKPTSTTGNWTIVDITRGWRPQASGGDAYLYPNLSNAEVSNGEAGEPTDTGFAIANFIPSASHIYLAIRAPY